MNYVYRKRLCGRYGVTMPLKTFENLPPERKKEIINAGLEEFSLHDFRSASLSKIIEKLGIAKGSFYR